MPRRKPPPELKPFVKSPLQLEQWAAYEALTKKHDEEAKARAELVNAAEEITGQGAVLHGSFSRWQRAQNIRQYVAATMALMPSGASQSAIDAASKWQTWALGVANEHDSAMKQVSKFLAAEDPA